MFPLVKYRILPKERKSNALTGAKSIVYGSVTARLSKSSPPGEQAHKRSDMLVISMTVIVIYGFLPSRQAQQCSKATYGWHPLSFWYKILAVVFSHPYDLGQSVSTFDSVTIGLNYY